jgi:hypothetical protein
MGGELTNVSNRRTASGFVRRALVLLQICGRWWSVDGRSIEVASVVPVNPGRRSSVKERGYLYVCSFVIISQIIRKSLKVPAIFFKGRPTADRRPGGGGTQAIWLPSCCNSLTNFFSTYPFYQLKSLVMLSWLLGIANFSCKSLFSL